MSMVEMQKEITEEQYNEISSLDNILEKQKKLYNLADSAASTTVFLPHLYGCFSPKVYKEKNKYYVSWQRYETM